jgi:WD40 repeat protein
VQVLSGRRNLVGELVFSHCGRWLAAGGYYGGVHVWDTANPTAKPRRPDPDGILYTNALAFRPDGRLFFRDGLARWFLFDPAEDELLEIKSPRGALIVPSPDAERAVDVSGAPGDLRVWSIRAKGKPVTELSVKRPNTQTLAAAFARDGTLATAERRWGTSTGCWQFIVIREAKTGKELRAFEGPAHSDPPRVAFSHDARHVLAYWKASVHCWSVAESDEKPRKGANPTRKHFLAMAVHPAGPLLTVDNGRMVRVWDVPAMTGDREIEWNVGKLHSVAVSPDGTRAAVGSHTGKVLVWDWD